MKVAVTGHRPDDLFGYDMNHEGWVWVWHRLVEELARLEAAEAITGMALGVDQLFAEVALVLAIPLTAYIPFKGQESKWPESARAVYYSLLKQAHKIVVVSIAPSVKSFHARNIAMVKEADVIIAVWTGEHKGGTGHCVRAAVSEGKPLVWIDPLKRRISLVAGGGEEDWT